MTTEYEQAILDAGIRQSDPYPYGWGGYDYYDAVKRAGGFAAVPDWRSRFDRHAFVSRFAWAIPGEGALAAIAEHAPILEVGAGSGYWAHELTKRGVDIVATDPSPAPCEPGETQGYRFERAWHAVVKMEGLTALRKFPGRALLFVWPCYARPWSGKVLAKFRGSTVLYVGEGPSGCTGDDRFHKLLGAQFQCVRDVPIPQWSGMHDRLRIYRRCVGSEAP